MAGVCRCWTFFLKLLCAFFPDDVQGFSVFGLLPQTLNPLFSLGSALPKRSPLIAAGQRVTGKLPLSLHRISFKDAILKEKRHNYKQKPVEQKQGYICRGYP